MRVHKHTCQCVHLQTTCETPVLSFTVWALGVNSDCPADKQVPVPAELSHWHLGNFLFSKFLENGPGTMTHVFNPSRWEAEGELYEFETRLVYITHSRKTRLHSETLFQKYSWKWKCINSQKNKILTLSLITFISFLELRFWGLIHRNM